MGANVFGRYNVIDMIDEEQPRVILIKELYRRPIKLTIQSPSCNIQLKKINRYSSILYNVIETVLRIIYFCNPA
jgi:hypothetical protein